MNPPDGTPPAARPLSTLIGGNGRSVSPMQGTPGTSIPSPPLQAEPVAEDQADPSAYRAFATGRTGRQLMLEIRFFGPMGIEEGLLLSMPQFVQAHFIHTDHVVLHFTNAVFQIEGRGMRQLIDHLKLGNLATIQEWSGRRWPEPAADQPKITRIAAITPETARTHAAESGRSRDEERGR